MNIKELEDKVMEIIKNISYVNDDGWIEIYLDYRDEELSNDTLEDIMESPNPRERFTEIINNWALDYDIGEVYGLCKSAWEETLREVKEVI